MITKEPTLTCFLATNNSKQLFFIEGPIMAGITQTFIKDVIWRVLQSLDDYIKVSYPIANGIANDIFTANDAYANGITLNKYNLRN